MGREWRRYMRRGAGVMTVGGAGVAAYALYNVFQLRTIAERSYRARAQVKAEDSNSDASQRLEKFPPRASQIQKLREEEFDVLVVGGGATGTGVALEAQTRG